MDLTGLEMTGKDSFLSQFQLTPAPFSLNREFEYLTHAAVGVLGGY